MLAVPIIALLLLIHSYPPSGRETFVPVLRTKVLPQYALLFDLLMPASPKARDFSRGNLIPLEPVDAYLESLQERPSFNVMLIIIEALRADVLRETIEGIPVMPILQDLAKEGVSFERAIAHSPETDYSQVSLYTGQYPLRSSVRDLHQDPHYPHVLIYDLLARLGYRSALITNEWIYTKRISQVPSLDLYLDLEFPLTDIDPDLLPEWFSRGRDPRSVHPARLDLLKVEVLERWLQVTDPRKPFVSGLFFYSSHFPYNIPPKDLISAPTGKDVEGGLSFFGYSPSKAPQLRTNYHVTLRYIDSLIGRVIEFLKNDELLDNTIVVITGDHGELFHEHNEVTHGGRLRPEVLHVPLIFYSPKLLRPTKESGRTVGHIDVAPTIVSLLGLPRLDHHQGIPLLGPEALPNHELTDRRLFAVTQGVVYEEGVVVWPWLLSRDLRSNEVRVDFFGSEPGGTSPLEPKQRTEMERALSEFREAQLGYYALPELERSRYQPPTVR
jgi:membrane-anchored protein YejM (alkaline phosphatase superfamily)